MKKVKKKRDEEKMRELVLLIISRQPGLSIVELEKTLFRIDFDAYAGTGQSVTGYSYIKRKRGCAPYGLLALLRRMVIQGEIGLVGRKLKAVEKESGNE